MAATLVPAASAIARTEVRAKPCPENNRSAAASRRARVSSPSLRGVRRGVEGVERAMRPDYITLIQTDV